jgi:hypothetical protein
MCRVRLSWAVALSLVGCELLIRVWPWAVVVVTVAALMFGAHVGSVRQCHAAQDAGTWSGGC